VEKLGGVSSNQVPHKNKTGLGRKKRKKGGDRLEENVIMERRGGNVSGGRAKRVARNRHPGER